MTQSDNGGNEPLTYRSAGVDIDAGNALVERLKAVVQRTNRPGVLTGLGGFGALFRCGHGVFRRILRMRFAWPEPNQAER